VQISSYQRDMPFRAVDSGKSGFYVVKQSTKYGDFGSHNSRERVLENRKLGKVFYGVKNRSLG